MEAWAGTGPPARLPEHLTGARHSSGAVSWCSRVGNLGFSLGSLREK